MRAEYEGRLANRRAAADAHDAMFRKLGTLRLAVALGGAVLAWWNFWLLPLPVLAFAALIVAHERIARKASHERRAIAYYERALARLDNRWMGSGETGARFADASHPYASDLDVFGHGSLFQLMNSARTAAGEAALARWLLAPGMLAEVRRRQEAIEELRPRLDLREDLALLGDDLRSALHAEAVIRWGTSPHEATGRLHQVLGLALSAGVLISFTLYMLHLAPLAPTLLFLLGELLFYSLVRRSVNRILAGVEIAAPDLAVLEQVLERLESEPFRSELLTRLRVQMASGGLPPSRQIRKLRKLVTARDQARNQMFAIVAEPLLWSAHFALAIEAWRQVSGPHVGEWIEAVGETEAVSSIAGYAAEHPADRFPEFAEHGALFDGAGIAHPLLPDATAVRNDVRLDAKRRLLIVSGSNMSGKSTLLRAVGLNAVLAWAGAPVRAERLTLSHVAVGASMRVQDSVLDGKSRFYAEITRVRQIVDMAGGDPQLLFLLDELLSGTNSHDRSIGAEAIVRSLVARGAIGLVTTHDLALARLADALAPAAANVHFEDHIEDGRIAFDYRMKPGVVEKSNALELMRSVGLEV